MKNNNYRLALDLGSTSLGWALIKLNEQQQPHAVIKAGVRIFNNGRDPKTEASLAVSRREARSMRRRRDRLLQRKARMLKELIKFGFFPSDEAERKALADLNPYELRAKGLHEPLTPAEFARALFHINQRRGFESNRKTDKATASDTGALKTAIGTLRQKIEDEQCKTVGEWLHKRQQNGGTNDGLVRARYRENRVEKDDGKSKIEKSYDLYIDRQMVEDEFNALWVAQARFAPALFTDEAYKALEHTLLFQRKLKEVKPGRCTFLPDEERAPLALPSVQRFRIYQEVANLRILEKGLHERELTLVQRDALVAALETGNKTFKTALPTILGLNGTAKFNLADEKRKELKGNSTCMILSHDKYFGQSWLNFTKTVQDEIVMRLLKEENGARLIQWLKDNTGVDEARAVAIADAILPDGYGSLSRLAIERILPELRKSVITYDKAVLAAGFSHHSQFEHGGSSEQGAFVEKIIESTGEIKQLFRFNELPYYGEPLQRFVGFGTNNPQDVPEKRYGKIANPTVHIGLNQVRTVVNALINKYGHPSEVIVEVARDLKQSKLQKEEDQKRQAANQRRNERIRRDIAATKYGGNEHAVKHADIQKWILWEELSFDIINRRCPYTGGQISAEMVLTDQVEIEHILPFSMTLDDSLNNKTIAMRSANRDKGNRTPWQAFGERSIAGYDYEAMIQRAELMPRGKRYRFAKDGYEQWLKDDKGFLARALNDTRYLSRVAREYLTLICPQNTRVIPGQMTAMLRAKFGLNDILGLEGLKNRNDHRHHAVDACVIGVTDQGLLQRFANASAAARQKQLDRLVEHMPDPWPAYREHVQRAVNAIKVSHKPDHGYEGAMFDATIYNAQGQSKSAAKDRKVQSFSTRQNQPETVHQRHKNKPYKGLLSNSNYCAEIYRTADSASWNSKVISTYEAYQIVRTFKDPKDGFIQLRHPTKSQDGYPLIMRLIINDYIRAKIDGEWMLLKVLKISSEGSITFIKHNETNIPARYTAKLAARKKEKTNTEKINNGEILEDKDKLTSDEISALNDEFFQRAISADALRELQARRVTISPIGEVNDPGFKE